ncbi:MAG: hypothetical protein JWM33_3968 [Caulobacteraceae bacterium]|nr:hypothetical protein [Caulobacteraceae bacterium]
MPDFSVHTRETPARHVRRLTEASFEAAALAYVEDLPHGVGEDEARVVVIDLATGQEQCFRVDLVSGDTRACG